jgi:hypothetical protein
VCEDEDAFLFCCDEPLFCDEPCCCEGLPNINLKTERNRNGITNMIINKIDKSFVIPVY